MKITEAIKKRRKENIDHLNRIQGQIETLKKYLSDNKKHCIDITLLTTSIAKSFDSLRARTLEGFIVNELLEDKKISPEKLKKLNRIIELYKK